jgi:branched-chain amino acid transport system substrate-binding protein
MFAMTSLSKFAATAFLSLLLAMPQARAAERFFVALSADMSSGTAIAGEAIRRGAAIAIDEINARGGVLGRPLALQVFDHQGNPARGRDQAREIAGNPDAVAVLGGLHSSVLVGQIATLHEHRLPILVPWAAAVQVVENGLSPNYVFRVSLNDELVETYLVRIARERGCRRPSFLFEQSAWGRSNFSAATNAMRDISGGPAQTQFFGIGEPRFGELLDNVATKNADCVVLAANPPEGAIFVTEFHRRPELRNVPIFAHWGILGGPFFDGTRNLLPDLRLWVVQTFSFARSPHPEIAAEVLGRCRKLFGECATKSETQAASGLAQAYDSIHLLAQAIRDAGSPDGLEIVHALERLATYRGLVKTYMPAFTRTRHEAMSVEDLWLARVAPDGALVPADR